MQRLHAFLLAALLLCRPGPAPCRAQEQAVPEAVPTPTPLPVQEQAGPGQLVTPSTMRPVQQAPREQPKSDEQQTGRPSQKSPLEQPPPPGGQAEKLPLPPLEPGDLRFPINLGTALRLSDARP